MTRMNYLKKCALIAGVCLLGVTTVGCGNNMELDKTNSAAQGDSSTSSDSESFESEADSYYEFTVKMNGEPLQAGKYIPISPDLDGNGAISANGSISEGDQFGDVDYELTVPLVIEGRNIKKVRYHEYEEVTDAYLDSASRYAFVAKVKGATVLMRDEFEAYFGDELDPEKQYAALEDMFLWTYISIFVEYDDGSTAMKQVVMSPIYIDKAERVTENVERAFYATVGCALNDEVDTLLVARSNRDSDDGLDSKAVHYGDTIRVSEKSQVHMAEGGDSEWQDKGEKDITLVIGAGDWPETDYVYTESEYYNISQVLGYEVGDTFSINIEWGDGSEDHEYTILEIIPNES